MSNLRSYSWAGPEGVARLHLAGAERLQDGPDREVQGAERQPIRFKLLDTVVLVRDLRERGLRPGDFGTVIEVFAPHRLEVEFVMASGRTRAVVELNESDVRRVGDGDLITVRRCDGLV